MRLNIIPIDGAVYVDSVSYSNLDLSSCNVPADVHALQWYETFGEVEFNVSFNGQSIVKPQNQIITELPAWANACVEKWNEAKEAEALAVKQISENQPKSNGTQTL